MASGKVRGQSKAKNTTEDRLSQRNAAVNTRPKTKKTIAKKSKRSPRPPRAVRQSQSDRRMRSPRQGGVSVTINVAAPRLHPKVAARLPKLPKLRKLPVFVRVAPRIRRPLTIGLVFIALFIVGWSVQASRHKPTPSSGKVAAAERTKPDFKPLLSTTEQATATQYDGKRNMLSYTTTFSGVRLTVSQQPLPKRFNGDPKELTSAADSLHAKARIDTEKGAIYIATNEDKTQLAIFGNSEILLFIHTDRQLDDPSWKAFIEQLKQK